MAKVRFSSIPVQDEVKNVCATKTGHCDVSCFCIIQSSAPSLPSTAVVPAINQNNSTENPSADVNETLSKMFKLAEDVHVPDGLAQGVLGLATADLSGDLQNVDDWFKSKTDSMSSLDFDTDLKNSEIDIGDLFNLKGGLHFQIDNVPLSKDNATAISDELQNNQSIVVQPESLLPVDKGIFEEMLLADSTSKLARVKHESQQSKSNEVAKISYEELLLPGIHDILASSSSIEKKEILLQVSSLQEQSPAEVLGIPNSEDMEHMMSNINVQSLKSISHDESHQQNFDEASKDGRWIKNLLSNKLIEDLNLDELNSQEISSEESGNLQSEFVGNTSDKNNEIDCKLSSILALTTPDEMNTGSTNVSCMDVLDTIDKNFLKANLGIVPDISHMRSNFSSKMTTSTNHHVMSHKFHKNVAVMDNKTISEKCNFQSREKMRNFPDPTCISNCAIQSSFNSVMPIAQTRCSSVISNSIPIQSDGVVDMSSSAKTTPTTLGQGLYQIVQGENNVLYLTLCTPSVQPQLGTLSASGSSVCSTASSMHFIPKITSSSASAPSDCVSPVLKLLQKQKKNQNTNKIVSDNKLKKPLISIPMLQPSLVFSAVKQNNKQLAIPSNLLQALQESYKVSPNVNDNLKKSKCFPNKLLGPIEAKVVKVINGSTKVIPSGTSKISIKNLVAAAYTNEISIGFTASATETPATHAGKAKVVMSVDSKANQTSVSVTSSNQEQTVFKINTCDLVRAVSSIKDSHLDPLGLIQAQLVQRAITANKFIKDIQMKNGLISGKLNSSGKLLPNQNFEVNQILPEFKPPVSRKKSRLKLDTSLNTCTPNSVVPSMQLAKVTLQTDIAKSFPLILPSKESLCTTSSIQQKSSCQPVQYSAESVQSSMLHSPSNEIPEIQLATVTKPLASVRSTSSTGVNIVGGKARAMITRNAAHGKGFVTSPISMLSKAKVKSVSYLKRVSPQVDIHAASQQNDFICGRKDVSSGIGMSLLPGALPTMVSVPSVLDSLSPVISSLASSTTLRLPYSSASNTRPSSASLKLISAISRSPGLAFSSVVNKPNLEEDGMDICKNPEFQQDEKDLFQDSVSDVLMNTDINGETACDAIDHEQDRRTSYDIVRDGVTSALEMNVTDISNDSKLEAVLTRALEGVGVSEEAVLAAQQRVPGENGVPEEGQEWCCIHPGCTTTCCKLSLLKVHILSHYHERPYRCTYDGCDWAFASSFKLKRHLETHLNRRDFVCEEQGCNRRFSTVYNLRSHRRSHHMQPHQWRCSVAGCEQTFRTKRLYQSHQRVHGDGQAPYRCTVEGCNKSYYSPSSLTFHTRNHSRDQSELRCQWPDCGKQYDKPCRLKAHMRVHTGQRPFICDFEGCKWSFKSSSKLTRHKRKHTNSRNFVCPMCQKSFLRSEHLKGHLLMHTGVRNFHCTHAGCNAKFTAKSSLYVHLKKHNKPSTNATGNNSNPPPPITLSFHCPVESCNKSYSSKASLREHMLSNHTPILAPDSNHLDYITLVGDREGLPHQLLAPIMSSSPQIHSNSSGINVSNKTSTTGDAALVPDTIYNSLKKPCINNVVNDRVQFVSGSSISGTSSNSCVSGTGSSSVSGTGSSDGYQYNCGNSGRNDVSMVGSSLIGRGFELMDTSGFSTGAGTDALTDVGRPLVTGNVVGLPPICRNSVEGGEVDALYPQDSIMVGHDLLTDAAQTTINLRDLD